MYISLCNSNVGVSCICRNCFWSPITRSLISVELPLLDFTIFVFRIPKGRLTGTTITKCLNGEQLNTNLR